MLSWPAARAAGGSQGPVVAEPRVQLPHSFVIPITIEERDGLARAGEPVRFGVPFPRTPAILNPAALLGVFDSQGRPVPCQWRVLSRWGNVQVSSMPVRWALLDFQASVGAGASAVYTVRGLGPEGAPAPPDPLDVQVSGPTTIVTTGPLQVAIASNTFDVFRSVRLDTNGNRVYEPSEECVNAFFARGGVLHDIFGVDYATGFDAPAVTVEESGPLHAVIRIDGLHRNSNPAAGIGRDYFKYTVRMHFDAGRTAVRVLWSIKNDYEGDGFLAFNSTTNPWLNYGTITEFPLGDITFQDYAVELNWVPSSGGGPVQVLLGGQSGPVSFATQPGEDYVLYQEGSGAASFNQDNSSLTIRGYQIWNEVGGTPTVVEQDDRSKGWLDVSDAGRGLLVAVRHFWQSSPKSIELRGGSKVRVGLFPSQTAGKELRFLADGTRRTHEILYDFHPGSGAAGGYAQAAAGRFAHPLRPAVPLSWVQSSRAWPDRGDLATPRDPATGIPYTPAQMETKAKAYRASVDASRDQGDDWGWWKFGESKSAQDPEAGGAPLNRLSFFARFVQSGDREFFEVADEWVRHSMDLRPYHYGGLRADRHPFLFVFQGQPHPSLNLSPDRLARDLIGTQYAAYQGGIPGKGHGYLAYDIEHIQVDDLYEDWLLTGNAFALEALLSLAEEVLTYPEYRASGAFNATTTTSVSAAVGYSMRVLMKAYQATGDLRYLTAAVKEVVNVQLSLPHDASWFTSPSYSWNQPFIHPVTKQTTNPPPWNGQLMLGIVRPQLPSGGFPLYAGGNTQTTPIYDWFVSGPGQSVAVLGHLLVSDELGGDILALSNAVQAAFWIKQYGYHSSANRFKYAASVHDDNLFQDAGNTGTGSWVPASLAAMFSLSPSTGGSYLQPAQVVTNALLASGDLDFMDTSGQGERLWGWFQSPLWVLQGP